jgi:hypothetical protein
MLVAHRHSMYADLRFPKAEIDRHDRRYRGWLRRRLRSREVTGFVATLEDSPAGSGCVWWRRDQPRPGVTDPTVPYVVSMYT